MYISKLAIKNYRNFGEPTFELQLHPFTLLLGENNSGKTNLLNAIGLIFSQDITMFKKRVLEIDDLNYTTIIKFKKDVLDTERDAQDIQFPEVLVEVTLKGMNDDQLAVVGDWFINKELTEAKITYKYCLKSNWDKKDDWIAQQREELAKRMKELQTESTGQKVDNEPEISEDDQLNIIGFPLQHYEYIIYGGDDTTNKCNPYYLNMLKMEYLDALRDAKKELIASGDYRLLYRILNRKDDTKYNSIKEILATLEKEIKGNSNLLEIKKEVEDLLGKVSLKEIETDNSIDFSFSSPEHSEMLKKISMTYGANPISVERNGLGRNNLLYISLILSHLADANYKGDKTFFRFVGIEEPEAHLHPSLQDHLAENIENIQKDRQDLQLLLTSHSTHIAAKLDLVNTVVLYKDQQYGIMKNHYLFKGLDGDKNTKHYLSKYLDATKSTLLFSRKIILVEGFSEQLLIPLFYRLYSNDKNNTLEKNGCSVINVNGVAFRHFLKVIDNGFYVKCVVFTDSDEGTKSENRAENLTKDFKKSTVIQVNTTTSTTFEKDVIEINKSGKGRDILLSALQKTKPNKGKQYKESLGASDINTEIFFEEIKSYKSEFAFNLSEALKKDSKNDFKISSYLTSGFDFLNK